MERPRNLGKMYDFFSSFSAKFGALFFICNAFLGRNLDRGSIEEVAYTDARHRGNERRA